MPRAIFIVSACLYFVSIVHGQDRVTYFDRSSRSGGTLLRTGSISSEDPGKLAMVSQDGRRTDIPVTDILDVQYDGEPLAEMNAARAAERDRKYDAALTAYSEALRQVPTTRKLLRRHLEYKLAEMRAALTEGGADAGAAIDALRAFAQTHSDGRQTLSCLEHLGRLLIVAGQPISEVNTALAQLRSRFGIDSKEVASRCDLLRSNQILLEIEQVAQKDMTLGKAKATAATKGINELMIIADRSIQPALQARQTFCTAFSDAKSALAAWETQLKTIDDPHNRAAIHLSRGDYYRLIQQYKEAMWDYLWVDTVYFADRAQQAKALFHLIDIFDKLGDTAKSRECKDRLISDTRFRDTRYSKAIK